MSDTEIVEKVKKVGTNGLLFTLGITLAGFSIVWLFNTVHTNSKNSAVLVETMPMVIHELQQMRQGNDAGHLAIFSKLSAIENGMARSETKIERLEKDCINNQNNIEECQGHIYKYPIGGQ